MIVSKKNGQSYVEEHNMNGEANRAGDNDLEMVSRRKTSSKSVMDDASVTELFGTSKKEAFACHIDKASRLLFPLLFVLFNVVYWVYFPLAS